MSIQGHFQVAFDRAVADLDNQTADGMNWNYVEADIYMANDNLIKEIGQGIYMNMFNEMVDAYLDAQEAA